jgi:hypothetical protein
VSELTTLPEPFHARQEKKQDEVFAFTRTFELVARMWMEKPVANRPHVKQIIGQVRSDDRCMSETPVSAALRGMFYAKEVMTAHGFRDGAHDAR